MTDEIKKQRAIEKIQEIKKLVDNGVILTARERLCMPSLGKYREKLVKTAIEIIEEDDGFLPKDHQPEKIKENFTQYLIIKEIMAELDKLKATLYDHYILAGTAAYKESLSIKKLLDHGLDTKYDKNKQKMQIFFDNRNKGQKPQKKRKRQKPDASI